MNCLYSHQFVVVRMHVYLYCAIFGRAARLLSIKALCNRENNMNHFSDSFNLLPNSLCPSLCYVSIDAAAEAKLSHFEMQFIAHNRWAPNETIFLSSRENIATISNLINSIKRFAVIDYDYLIAYSSKWVQQLATPTTLIDPVDKSVDSLDGKCAFVLIQINDVDGLWQPK